MKQRTKIILEELKKMYPDAKCELNHETPFQLLVATILSAQTTDKKVNEVTEDLFKEYPDVDAFLTLSIDELENKIKQIGLYRSKAKNILIMCNQLKSKFNGEVPRTMDEITSLAGAGRKTANVIQSVVFNKAAMAVDTHVFRVSHRIGLVPQTCTTPLATEKYLMKYIPEEIVPTAHHWLILHGRYVCMARTPKCEECGLNGLCQYSLKPKI